MNAPTTLLWERDPHTGAKHDLLRRYLQAWLPIMLHGGFPGVTYAEGFAGPGEYLGGEPGSPIIALEQILGRPAVVDIQRPIRVVFVEKEQPRFDHLRSLVRERWPVDSRPDNVTIRGECGDCFEKLVPLLDVTRAWGAPMLVNLDGWGMIPLELVQRIGRNKPSAEVLITFTAEFFVRFAEKDDIASADAMFGHRDWRSVAALPSDQKKLFVVDEYRKVLASVGFPYSTAFEMVDERGRYLYIVYGTGHRRGLEVMKDVMWKVDPVYGVRYRDPRDRGQITLDILDEPNLAPLRRMLLERVREVGRCRVEDLRDWALFDTVYRPTHAHELVRQLVRDGTFQRDPGRGQVTKQTTIWAA